MAHVTIAGLLLAAFGPWHAMATIPEPWGLNLSAIAISTRLIWCESQERSCPIICDRNPLRNSCDHGSLSYACECAVDEIPDMKLWAKTMPSVICQEAYRVCYSAAADDPGRQRCHDNIQVNCSTREPGPMSLLQQELAASATSFTTTFATGNSAPPSTPTADISTTFSTAIPSASTITLGPLIAGVVVGAVVFIIAVAGLFYWLGRRRRSSHERDQRRRDRHSPQPPHPKPSEATLTGADSYVVSSSIQKVHSRQASTIDKEAIGGGSSIDVDEKSEGLKTLVTEKLQGHEMVRDLSAMSPLDDDEKYFDTAKYRMPPPAKEA